MNPHNGSAIYLSTWLLSEDNQSNFVRFGLKCELKFPKDKKFSIGLFVFAPRNFISIVATL